jgi:RNA methyltransferase, TrmH family
LLAIDRSTMAAAAAFAPLGSFRLSPSVLMMMWIGLGGNHCARKVMPPSLLLSRLSFARRSSSVVSGGGGSLQVGRDSHNNNDDRSSSSSRGKLLPDLITSPQSKTIKTLSGLLSRKKRRDEMGEAVAEGPRMVLDLIRNPRTQKWVRQVVVSDAKWDAYAPLLWEAASLAATIATAAAASSPSDVHCSPVLDEANDAPPDVPFQLMRATPEVLDSCTDTVTNQGIVARVRIPTHSEDAVHMARADGPRSPLYVVLDGLQDPGNVGTLIRSCVATGAAQVLLLPGCTDVWSPKALRSAMGSTFLLPVRTVASFDDLLETLQRWGCHRVYAATMEDASNGSKEVRPSAPHGSVDWTVDPTALVIGSEGNGLSREVRQALGDSPDRVRAVHVPMLAGVESLNAAVCGSVILFERLRQLQQQSAAVPETSDERVDQRMTRPGDENEQSLQHRGSSVT